MSCPVSALVCLETANERDALRAEIKNLRASFPRVEVNPGATTVEHEPIGVRHSTVPDIGDVVRVKQGQQLWIVLDLVRHHGRWVAHLVTLHGSLDENPTKVPLDDLRRASDPTPPRHVTGGPT